MARIWIEIANPRKHADFMPLGAVGGFAIGVPKNNLLHRKILLVEVCAFTFQFMSKAQLETTIAYFQSPSGSTRLAHAGLDHWERQSWQSRLPAGINNAHNRPKVLAALVQARRLANEHML